MLAVLLLGELPTAKDHLAATSEHPDPTNKHHVSHRKNSANGTAPTIYRPAIPIMDIRSSSMIASSSRGDSVLPGGSEAKRTAKACENCRLKRIKCGGPYPCAPCVRNGLKNCQVREKPRPNRKPLRRISIPTDSTSPSSGPSTSRLPIKPENHFVTLLGSILEETYSTKTGTRLLFNIEENILPYLKIDDPLPPLPSLPIDGAEEMKSLIEVLSTSILNTMGLMTLDEFLGLARRYRSGEELEGDDSGILFACLAIGRCRRFFQSSENTGAGGSGGQGFNQYEQDGRDEGFREDVAWYRHSVERLTIWNGTSLKALKAYLLLHVYTMMLSPAMITRQMISGMANQARQLQLGDVEKSRVLYTSEENVEGLLFHVVFSDHCWSTISGQPPHMALEDYQSAFRYGLVLQLPPGTQSAQWIRPESTLYEFLLMQGELLEKLHSGRVDPLDGEFIMTMEARWMSWLEKLKERKDSGGVMGWNFTRIHYHWNRLMLRGPCIGHSLLSMSSLAIMARSAQAILQIYETIYRGPLGRYPWPHIKHVTTCGYVMLVAYLKMEVSQKEVEESMGIVLWLLGKLSIRWKSAHPIIIAITAFTKVFDLDVKHIEDTSMTEYHPLNHYHSQSASTMSVVPGPIPVSFEQQPFDLYQVYMNFYEPIQPPVSFEWNV